MILIQEWLVVFHSIAVEEFSSLKQQQTRHAVLNAMTKLKRSGPNLTMPHCRFVKGTKGLFELRPNGGRSTVRPLYIEVDRTFVILTIAPEAEVKPAGFRSAVDRACKYARQDYGQEI